MSDLNLQLIESTLEKINIAVNRATTAEVLGLPEEIFAQDFSMALGEARQTLCLLIGLEIESKQRILEVGAGLGIASCALSIIGHDVVALEPGGIGFESNQKLSVVLAEQLRSEVSVINETAELVKFPQDSKFDFIISNNVLEHVQDYERALKNLSECLSESGMMIHSCPNYTFPYEPHFGSPLIPFFPRLTKFVIPKRISKSGLWQSLNFISARQLKKIFCDSDSVVLFKRGQMAKSFIRLSEDEEFKKRHSALGRIAASKIFLAIMKRTLNLPYWLATPMTFAIVHRSKSSEPRVLAWLEN